MAPAKRSSKVPAAAAKKPRVDPTVAWVTEVVRRGELPDSCLKMVLACLPSLLDTPVEERQEPHLLAVKWVEEVMASDEAKLRAALDAQAAAVQAADQAKAGLEAAVAGGEAALEAVAAAAKAKVAELAAATTKKRDADSHLLQRQEAQAAGDADMNKSKAELAALEAAVEAHLQPLADGRLESGEAHYAALLTHVQGAGLEDSLVAALPAACVKKSADRTSFDVMVIDALGQCLRGKASSLSQAIQAAAPDAQARADDVARARAECDAAAGAQRALAEALSQAQEQEREATEAVQKAKAEVLAHAPSMEQAKTTRDQTAEALDYFQSYSKGCWELMRDGQPKKAEGKVEEKEDEAAAPVAAAGA